jgi:DUF1680 family protein
MFNPIKAIPLKQVRIDNPFWSRYIQLVRTTVIPYQWEALNDRIADAEPSHAIQNFRIAAGKEQGEFHGFVFQDSDLAKWLEAVGYSLAIHPDPNLEQLADDAIDLIADAQEEDGYLNTYFTIKAPTKRWSNLVDCHELYCAGHMIEAAVAYYQATGKRKLLDIMCRFADLIDTTFGEKPEQLQGYCGHQEIELALVKLYQATQVKKYLKLSQYFINERGTSPSYFLKEWEQRGKTSHWSTGISPAPDLSYNQSHLPVREQSVAVGHAVRAVYMYTAMADLAALTNDQGLLDACRRLWSNITTKQMYLTGGIGSTNHGEAFTFDYDLPNDTIYAETCASIGLIFFAHRMLQIEAKSEYADVLERALYNNVIGSMSLDGKSYFYVNPLEVWPEASKKNPTRHHVKAVRQPWFGCSCCPPNVARLIASLGQYIYSTNDETIYTHLYIGSEVEVQFNKQTIKLHQETNYPWDGDVKITISLKEETSCTLALRIPDWCTGKFDIHINGKKLTGAPTLVHGYLRLERAWSNGDTIELNLAMEIQYLESNPRVRVNAGKSAIQRGPLVYCLEEVDNGQPLSSMSLPKASKLTAKFDPDLLGGIVVIEGDAQSESGLEWGEELYRPAQAITQSQHIKAIPYYLWGNRTQGEMCVWIRSQN